MVIVKKGNWIHSYDQKGIELGLFIKSLQKLTIAFLSYINVIIYNIIQTSWYVFICLFSDDFAATIFKSC